MNNYTLAQWVTASQLSSKDAIELLYHTIPHPLFLDQSSWYMAHQHEALNAASLAALEQKAERRRQNEPMAYILGHITFCDLALEVNHDVLIPRQETEELVHLVTNYLDQHPSVTTIAEIGTGSGAIAIALADFAKKSNRDISFIATDISAKALEVAKTNAAAHQLTINFRVGNLLEPMTEKVDIIVANLPYIPTHWITKLDTSVHYFEPEVALDGGPEGLTLIHQLTLQASLYLNPNGRIFLELWNEHTAEDFKQFSQFKTTLTKDAFGHTRFATLELIG